jgi:hypothetical protein
MRVRVAVPRMLPYSITVRPRAALKTSENAPSSRDFGMDHQPELVEETLGQQRSNEGGAASTTPSTDTNSDATTFLIGASSGSVSRPTHGGLSILASRSSASANFLEFRAGEVRAHFLSALRRKISEKPSSRPSPCRPVDRRLRVQLSHGRLEGNVYVPHTWFRRDTKGTTG